MNEKNREFCLNAFERVGTDWNRGRLSNNVGTAVLRKKRKSSEFGGILVFVCPVGTVGQETSVVEKSKQCSVPSIQEVGDD